MKDLKFDILMPVYNGGPVIAETLQSILNQSFTNYQIIIVDDCSQDNTERVIKRFKDPRVKYFRNNNNLGYSRNLEVCRKRATGEIIFLMGQDDILGADALLNTNNAFKKSDRIGAVTRPYFWFDGKIDVAVRAKEQLNPERDEVVTINDDFDRIIKMFMTLDQLSGLAMRRKYLDLPFHIDVFPCHVYPFASIFKKHPVVFLKDYNVAVRIRSSQSRSVSSIYNKSPIQSWRDLFNSVFFEVKFRSFREYCLNNFVAKNYVGLIQIRNYAKYRYFLREVFLLVKYRWQNLFNGRFWFFSIGCLVMPAFLLIPLVDWYKKTIYSQNYRDINFQYKI